MNNSKIMILGTKESFLIRAMEKKFEPEDTISMLTDSLRTDSLLVDSLQADSLQAANNHTK